MGSARDSAKKVIQFGMKFKLAIAKAVRLFSSVIGQIILYILGAILLVLLVYIIVSVIAKDIAKILKLDGGAQSGSEDYEYLRQLTNSGYDDMLSASELVDFHAFEYAVLMDAARFMEETGTLELEVSDQAKIKIDKLPKDRHIWAMLAASALFMDNANDPDFAGLPAKSWELVQAFAQKYGLQDPVAMSDPEPGTGGGGNTDPEESGDTLDEIINDFIGKPEDYSTEYTDEQLFYEKVYNEYTKEYSLYPYLEMPKIDEKVKYHIEYRDTASELIAQEVLQKGTQYNMEQGKNEWFGGSRFEGGSNAANYKGLASGYNYIYEHLFPTEMSAELNKSNTAAYGDKAKALSGEDDLDLYKDYPEGLYYNVEAGPSAQDLKIPLRVLLDRFLPNATLLSAWRMLSTNNDETKDEDLVDEIKRIYSEATLADEEYSGDKLLVKDVYRVDMKIDENTSAADLFDKVAIAESSKAKYLDGESTKLLFGSYEAEFDSRIWAEQDPSANPDPGANPDPSANPDPNDPGTSSSEPVQAFEGGFSGDVISDIKLALTHFSENNNINLLEEAYDKIMADTEKYVAPSLDEEQYDSRQVNSEYKDSTGQFIIYRPVLTAGVEAYRVKCEALESNNDADARRHYNVPAGQELNWIYEGGVVGNAKVHPHEGANNPYDYTSSNSDVKECLVPFMKIAYTQENGFRITSVIIYYNNEYFGYLVKGKELEDYNKMTNKNTFAIFETRQMRSTTPRHWVITFENEESEENWIAQDAYEGLSVFPSSYAVDLSYTDAEGQSHSFTLHLSASEAGLSSADILGIQAQIIEKLEVNSKKVSDKDCLPAGSTAIVRQNEGDPSSRDYTGLLTYPTDTSINGEYTGMYGGGSSTMTTGETVITDRTWINLKELGMQEGEEINVTLDGTVTTGASLSASTVRDIIAMHAYLSSVGRSYSYGASYSAEDRAAADAYYSENITNAGGGDIYVSDVSTEFGVIIPTRRVITVISQEFWDKSVTFYLVNRAKTWSGIKQFSNQITINGEFNDRDNWMYLISSNPWAKGIQEYNTYKNIAWRTSLYAPVLSGKTKDAITARETDVQLVVSEWDKAASEGMGAADYFTRDLYALINYSKGIKDGEDNWIIEPEKNADGKEYVNYNSYKYTYIPDEVMQFDDTIAEKAFWLDRLISTEKIDEETENKMRSRAQTFTWQIVDYTLYDECQSEDNSTTNVYPLWMFGDQLTRDLYAIAANASPEENKMVLNSWGGYSAGFHPAADLYGRSLATRIREEIFGNGDEALIKSEYSNGQTRLIGTNSTNPSGDPFLGDNEVTVKSGTGGLYRSNTPVDLLLDGTVYKFNSSVSAVYGYELYRQTAILKSAEKAEALLKSKLMQEEEWTKLLATVPGIVTRVSGTSSGGFHVEIQHTISEKDNEGKETVKQVNTTYSHMKRYPLVQEGQYVGAGTLLGYEGTTGNSNGYHVHFTIDIGELDTPPSPVRYMYPFFTPFYYEEKAIESGYALDSEYMSTSRTVFPYGQIVDDKLGLPLYGEEYPATGPYYPTTTDNLSNNPSSPNTIDAGDNPPGVYLEDVGNNRKIVKLMNYVPYKIMMEDVSMLIDESYATDFSKLPTKNIRRIGNVSYMGEIIKTSPEYFDEEFMKKVAENNGKIKGLNLGSSGSSTD